jgi:Na+/proline symporter
LLLLKINHLSLEGGNEMNGILVLIVYGVLMIGATLLFTKKEKDTESFLVSNRKMKTH